MLLLHILLTILKILGILLLIAVGLLLLIVLALLFVPVTYTVQGDKSQETWGISGRVSWLFGGISARFWHRGETGWELRLLGIPVRKLMRRLRGGKRRKRQEKKTSSGRKEKGASAQNGPSPSDESPVQRTPSFSKGSSVQKEPLAQKESPCQETKAAEGTESGEPERGPGRIAAAVGNLWRRIRSFFVRLVQLPGKIAGRIRKMWLTFRRFCDKIRRWKEFLTRDTTKAAVKFLLGRGRALLVHILPRKVRGNVTVGFEDPAMTGQLLAAAGVFYPLYKENIQITPVFDRQVLEGDFLIKGRIFGAAFVWTAWKIYRNRNVRITWQGFRNKEA
ncbi:MAG: DUF2953 domain-containing protein [Clostridiales bacterium]|nr:DUF2953 domain-containing protein [Clostridiales bacterium]